MSETPSLQEKGTPLRCSLSLHLCPLGGEEGVLWREEAGGGCGEGVQ